MLRGAPCRIYFLTTIVAKFRDASEVQSLIHMQSRFDPAGGPDLLRHSTRPTSSTAFSYVVINGSSSNRWVHCFPNRSNPYPWIRLTFIDAFIGM